MLRWIKQILFGTIPTVGYNYSDGAEAQQNKRLIASGAENLYRLLNKFPVDPAAILRRDGMESRLSAASLLWNFPSAKTAEMLQHTIAHDPEYLVRYPAAKSLLLIYGYTHAEMNQHMHQIAPMIGTKTPLPTPEALDMIQQLIRDRPIGLAK